MRAAVPFTLSLLVLAGCLGGGAPAETKAAVNATAGGGLNLQSMASGAPPVDAAKPTLDAPPQWRQGEWWTVKVTDGFDGGVYTGTRIVAGMEPDDYLVGMPQGEFSDQLMVLHIPGFGQVSKKDLSFDVHNKNFAPLNFPLTEGKEWDTAFEGRPIHAKAHVTSPTEAVISLQGANDHMNVTYDATLGEIKKIAYDGYADLEVTGHGYGYQGVVTVPHMFKLVFQNARVAGVLDGSAAPQPGVDETVTVDPTFDRVSFVILLGNLQAGVPTAAGYYRETVTGPDGTSYDLQYAPPEDAGAYKMGFFTAQHPGGDWKFHHVAAGPGIAMAEGIAYHVYQIDLPSGRILPSTGQHHHGG